jgi:PqqD family protein of HPr-rel-A system
VYRSVRVETLRIVWLDDFTVIYHRASGITHLLNAPAPEILGALGEAGMTLAALADSLTTEFDLPDLDLDALVARLDELVAAGLVIAQSDRGA